MSEIKFACIHCGQKLSCDHALTGQRISCPACQRSVLVPWTPTASEAPKAGGASSNQSDPPAFSKPGDVPKVSIPQLSPPDLEDSARHTSHKVLQLEGRNRVAPRFSILAALSFALSLAGPFGCVPAILCGHIAKWQMRRNAALRGDSLATAGLAIAYTAALLTGVFVARTLLRRL